ncbi:hypothetical protein [Bradyrhizobium sp. STM 3809]|uniref:hypothetical protein n=1 Tax=Bradyrhizobium sp. STM 3809 TaxID=551936 RepID=UPI001111AC90|nr:hypothetical protein [Bradyrhizobium sp. STM 3809]
MTTVNIGARLSPVNEMELQRSRAGASFVSEPDASKHIAADRGPSSDYDEVACNRRQPDGFCASMHGGRGTSWDAISPRFKQQARLRDLAAICARGISELNLSL